MEIENLFDYNIKLCFMKNISYFYIENGVELITSICFSKFDSLIYLKSTNNTKLS